MAISGVPVWAPHKRAQFLKEGAVVGNGPGLKVGTWWVFPMGCSLSALSPTQLSPL